MKKLFILTAAVLLISISKNAEAQTTLSAGDVALVGINSANPDKFSIVLLKSITANTVIHFTDNGFTGNNLTGRTGEGFLTYTASSSQTAGTILSWTNGASNGSAWSSNSPSNFSFNASGDQLFIFQGNTANWASQSGITLLFGINYGTALSGTSSAANTLQPNASILPATAWINLPSGKNANGYFANGTSSTSSVSVAGTSSALLALITDTNRWFGNWGSAATFPAFNITVCTIPAAVTASSNTPVCSGLTLSLTASATGATSYSWSGPNGFSSSSQNPTRTNAITAYSGTYTLTAANSCGSAIATTSVTVNTLPTATITAGGPTTFCTGGSVTLTATSGMSSYLWSNGATTQAINATSSGNYSVTVTNANGCTASSASKNVTINTLPPAAITAGGPTTFCTGGSVLLTATSGMSSYLWSNGAATQAINATSSGNYSVTVTDANGCSATSTATHVTAKDNSTSASSNTSCNSYLWNGTTYTVSGTYTAHLTNSNGCDSTATLNLVIKHSTTSNTTQTACNSYLWNATTYTASGTYTYATQNAVGCDSVATLNLTINHGTTSNTTQTACNSYLWNATTYAASGTYTFNTTNAAGCDSVATLNLTINHSSSSTTNQTACNSYLWNATTYTATGTYTFNTTNAAGCDSVATLVLTINPSPVQPGAFLTKTTFVYRGQTGVIYTVPDNAAATYSWSFSGTGATINGSGNSVTIDYSPIATSGTLSVTANNPCGASAARTLAIALNAPITVPTTSYDYSFVTLGCNRVDYLDTTFSTGDPDYSCGASTANVYQLKRVFTEISHLNPLPKFLIMTGDIVMGYLTPSTPDTTALAKQLTAWKAIYESHPLSSMGITLIAIPGNHETQDKAAGKHSFVSAEKIFTRIMAPYIHGSNGPGAGGPDGLTTDQSKLTYSFNYRGDHYIIIDTDPVGKDGITPYHWIAGDIQTARANHARHIFAFGHKPAYSSPYTPQGGLDAASTLAQRDSLWKYLENNNCEAMFSAHEHLWDSIHPHIGKTWQVINGDGGTRVEVPWVGPGKQYYGYTLVNLYTDRKVNVMGLGRNTAMGTTVGTSYPINEDANPTIVRNNFNICLTTTSSTNITACSSYTWNGITRTSSGTYTYTTTNAAGCDSVATLNLTINSLPSVVANASATTVCAGNSVTLTGSGASTYSWASGVIDGVGFIPTITDTYTVTGTNANGCTNTATITVVVDPLPSQPDAFTTGSPSVNRGQNGVVYTIPNDSLATYTWSYSGTGATINGSGNSVTIDFSLSAIGGTLSVTATNGCGTSAARTMTVTITPAAIFTSGRLVVVQTAGSASKGGSGVTLKEYTTSGTTGVSVAIPATGATPLQMAAGPGGSEGFLTRSTDGTSLMLAGFSTATTGIADITVTSASSTPRVIFKVDALGNYTQVGSSTTFYSGNDIRGAISGGTNYWASGASNATDGINYYGPGASTALGTGAKAYGLQIFNGQIYYSTQKTSAFNNTFGIFSLGNGLPTSGTITPVQVINTGSAIPEDFSFNPAGDVCYIAINLNTSVGGIQKWTKSGTVWSLAYTLGTGVSNIGAYGLVVDYSGLNPVLYATTFESNTDGNRIIKITDTGSGSTAITLATAAAKTWFHGISFSPSCPIPTQPAAFTTSAATVNQGQAGVTYSVPNDPLVTYSWSYSGSGATIHGTGNSVTVDFSSIATGGTLIVTAANACGISAARSMAVAINGNIRITEYMYNGAAAGSIGEFVELTNVGGTSVDMTGWSFDDNSRTPGSQSLSAFGTVQPGESVILTDNTVSAFRSAWGLCAGIKIIGGNTNNLGREDEINIYDASNILKDRLTYGDQMFAPGTIRTNTKSGWVNSAALGTNTIGNWTLSAVGDAEGSIASSVGDIGSPGKSTRATVLFDPCVIVNGAPTIVMDVNNTTNYLDGGVTTAPVSPYSVSGTISDPTDPASTLGIDFTINDAETAAGSLTVTATSSNTLVVPTANLNLTGSGASRNIKITPAAVGYSNITVTVNDGTSTTSYVINYAASDASTNPASTIWHTGMSDGSDAIAIDDNYYISGDDELNVLNVYSRSASGLPLKSYDYTSSLNLPDPSKPEVDLEAATRSASNSSKIYWLGSMSNGKAPFDNKPNRNRLFATTISGTGANTAFTFAGYYGNLRASLLTWGDANGYNFTASAAAGIDSKAIDGFAVEGMVFGPDNTTLYIGMRAPLVPTANRTKAVIAPILNFETWFNNGAPSGNPTFGSPIELNLGNRGIRELIRLSNGTYIILAGNYAGDPVIGAIYKWSGKAVEVPVLVDSSANAALNMEGAMQVNVNGQLSLTKLQVITDKGGDILYNDGAEAKDFGDLNLRKFRSDNLSALDLSLCQHTTSTTIQTACNSYLWNATTYTASGTYTFTTQNAAGCDSIATLNLTINPLPSVVGSASAMTVCAGTSVTLTGSGASTYSWTGGVSNGVGFIPTATSTYTVTGTDAHGCTNTALTTVTVNPLPSQPGVFTASSTSVNRGQNGVTYTVPNDSSVTYLWSYSGAGATIHGSGNSVTVDFSLNVTNGTLSVIATNGCISAARTIVISIGITGPSSSQSPYLLPVVPTATFTSVLTTPDVVGGYKMCGTPDGLGAFDNGNGTFTLLMNHEFTSGAGVVRAHGSKGAFVSKWIINKSNLSVISGSDLMQNVKLWNGTGYNTYNAGNPSPLAAFSRFCSADLPPVSAFYNSVTGLGTQERIFMNGEENNDESRALAHIVTGPNAGTSYELPYLGKAAWENSVASPHTGDKTVVGLLNDGTDGQVYFYIGTKTNTGTEIDKAGLNGGHPFGVKVTGFAKERINSTTINLPPAPGTRFSLVDLGTVQNMTGAAFNTASNTAGVTSFSRPEDGAWDPSHPNDFYFNTTDQFDQVVDGVGSQVGRTRVWRLRFDNVSHPELGGTVEAVIDGTEGVNMLDNMAIDNSGHILLLEDVGNSAHNGKVWQYTIATDVLTMVGKHDPARFGDIGVPATAPFNQDEETSGIIDVQNILGAGMFLLVDQAHYPIAGEAVEGGQLLAYFNPDTYNANPNVYAITGGGSHCSGDTASLPVGLAGSQSGVKYQLVLNNIINIGAPKAGTGYPISFGNQTAAGVYTVLATDTITSHTAAMVGSANIIVNPLPAATITASGSVAFCAADSVTLTAPAGMNSYLWSNGATAQAITVKVSGNYSVTVINNNGCSAVSDATIVTVSTLAADINKDGVVDNEDFLLELAKFNQSCTGCREDINNDGIVDNQDFLLLLGCFNQSCTGAMKKQQIQSNSLINKTASN